MGMLFTQARMMKSSLISILPLFRLSLPSAEFPPCTDDAASFTRSALDPVQACSPRYEGCTLSNSGTLGTESVTEIWSSGPIWILCK